MLNVEKIEKEGDILAIILKPSVPESVVEFVTPTEFSLQLGVHERKKGDYVKAHEHIPLNSNTKSPVQDIILMKKGKISVGLYYKNEFYKEIIISAGEVIIISTGHNVKFMEDTAMIEIKQGPYRGREVEKKFLE